MQQTGTWLYIARSVVLCSDILTAQIKSGDGNGEMGRHAACGMRHVLDDVREEMLTEQLQGCI